MGRLTQLRHRTLGRWQTKVDVHAPHQLTRMGTEAPTDLDVEPIWTDVLALYQTGLHPALGLTLQHQGRVILDRTVGHVHNESGQAPGPVVTPDTPFNLFSASKILTALVVHSLVEDGKLALDDFAADTVPELAFHGKERIRIRHLLSHTAGIPDLPRDVDVVASMKTGTIPWDVLGQMPLVSEPGHKVAYHPVTSWSILQEICERITATDLRTLAHRRLLEPAGITTLNYGVSSDRVHTVAKHARTGLGAPGPVSRIFERTIGVDLDTAVRLTNESEFLTAILPSANVCGTGREVTALLELIRRDGHANGHQILAPQTLHTMIHETTPRRFDGTFGFPMKYGLGVMRGGRAFSLFGLDTPTAYGHLGFTNVVVYADPSRDLSVSFLNTGKPMLAPGMVLWYRVLQRIASTVAKT